MRKSYIVFFLFILLLFESGCWDNRSIKDKTLINGISIDITGDQKIEINALILNIIGKGIGVYEFSNDFLTSNQSTVFESGINMQSLLPGDIATSKTRILLIGEEFSKQKFLPLLDMFNRRTFSNLNLSLAIANKQPAKKILEIKTILDKPLSTILSDTIQSSENISLIPHVDFLTMLTLDSEEGIDYMLPVIDKTMDDHIEVVGAGLFSKGKYTGNLIPTTLSPTLMLLMDTYGKTGYFSADIPKVKKQDQPYNKITYEVIRPSRKITVHASKNKLSVDIEVKAKVKIDEITSKKNIKMNELQKIIKADLNNKAQKVIADIQKSNSDVIGIGRYLKEHNPKIWKKLDWDTEYPNLKINSKVDISFLRTGGLLKNGS